MDQQQFKPKITCFYCINAFDGEPEASLSVDGSADIHFIKMACSSMTKDIFLLKAFESGADGVIVVTCPPQACRYVKGALRAQKRIDWVKNILDDVGLNGNRLFLDNMPFSGSEDQGQRLQDIVKKIKGIGPTPIGE